MQLLGLAADTVKLAEQLSRGGKLDLAAAWAKDMYREWGLVLIVKSSTGRFPLLKWVRQFDLDAREYRTYEKVLGDMDGDLFRALQDLGRMLLDITAFSPSGSRRDTAARSKWCRALTQTARRIRANCPPLPKPVPQKKMGEYSIPMTKAEIARRLYGDGKHIRGRLVERFLKKYGCVPFAGNQVVICLKRVPPEVRWRLM